MLNPSQALHAKVEEQKVDLRDIAEKYLLKPFAMLFREPILLLITVSGTDLNIIGSTILSVL
jgi:DHA1 family multidrug resistance protein-like MFS transporter